MHLAPEGLGSKQTKEYTKLIIKELNVKDQGGGHSNITPCEFDPHFIKLLQHGRGQDHIYRRYKCFKLTIIYHII